MPTRFFFPACAHFSSVTHLSNSMKKRSEPILRNSKILPEHRSRALRCNCRATTIGLNFWWREWIDRDSRHRFDYIPTLTVKRAQTRRRVEERILRRWPAAASLGLCVLMLAAGRAQARAVDIKEDESQQVTGFRVVPQDIVDNARGRQELLAKVMRIEVQRVPERLWISTTYFIFPECNNRLILEARRPVTRNMANFTVRCR